MLINQRPERFSLFLDAAHAGENETVLLFHGNEVLLNALREEGRLPLRGEIAAALTATEPLHAFTQDDRRVFLADTTEDVPIPEGFVFTPVRAFTTLLPTEDGYVLNAAYHLAVWYRTHRFCGACGGETAPEEYERALTCRRCGLTIFPSISPAVIVAITNGDRLLLARNALGMFRHFSLIAGYVEVGETAEQAVHRETMEEVGLRLKDVRFLASQPWGLSQSLMFGFYARLDGDDTITLQESELAEARWFTREELPETASASSIAFDLINRFRLGTLPE
ncbi:MAG: NAD(+) diphosphatase [Eubacteriales bacterium]|nr:NAD(+) diphosphatase [Eubacteriales bacterium]